MFIFFFAVIITATATVSATATQSSSSATNEPRPTDFIDCNNPCNGGDVNYELIASVQTMKMGFGNYTYRGRTFARPPDQQTVSSGKIPQEGNQKKLSNHNHNHNHMGPTMYVKPGQSVWIKFRNEMYKNDTTNLSPAPVKIIDYWSRLQVPGEKIKYQYYKKPVNAPELMDVDIPNIPNNFDSTNLHLHGLDVEVHMFDPVGTHNPEASHVAIHPGECYCYRFKIPNDHPDGMYWYHPHLHGSSAIQLWGGMMGLLYVQGNLEKELIDKYNVQDSREFIIWDPAFQDITEKKPTATHNIEVDEFLLGQTTLSKIHPFLVNGEITPTFDRVGVNEVLHLRVLCSTIENENTFIIYKYVDGKDYANANWEVDSIPFYQIASDGVTYQTPIKRNIIVLAGGQREEVLLQFNETGKYVISQQGIQGMQFFDMYGHPHDQLLATINVIDKYKYNKDKDKDSNVDKPTMSIIDDMIFTPGYSKDETIESHQITKTETIVFSMGANRNMAPFPQYYVNGKSYNPNEINFYANPGDAVEYILINANHNVHPVSSLLIILIYIYCKHIQLFDRDRRSFVSSYAYSYLTLPT